MKIAIIGAGLAGLSCASRLAAAGHQVRLFDKGRRAGGRMSTRRTATRLGEASFDHGAQYFTARDPAFRRQVAAWQAGGLVAPWPAARPDAWVGTPGMDAPLQHLAAGLDVRWSAHALSIARRDATWSLHGAGLEEAGFDTMLLAVPAENAAPLLSAWDAPMAAIATANPAQPCWTVLAAFAKPLAADMDTLSESGPIGWAARNSAKPGRTGPESWVIQADPAWSGRHLEHPPETIIKALMAALAAGLRSPLPEPLMASAHRWRYARSGNAGIGALWNPDPRLGACGDWLLGPRVECAWLSGARLADAVLHQDPVSS